jgi:hypothetical protein
VKSSDALRALVGQEIRRNLRPVRVLLLFGLAMLLAYREVGYPHDGAMPHLLGALTRDDFWLQSVVVLVAAAMGGALAEDRRCGFTLTVVARGGSRRRYLAAKLLGASASSALMTLFILLGFFAMVALQSPAERTAWELEAWPRALVPELARDHPVLHDLLVASAQIVASAAIAPIGVAAGILVANEYIAMAAVPVVFIALTLALYDTWRGMSPFVYLELRRSYNGSPRDLTPPQIFLYWAGFSALMILLCRWLLARKRFV